LEKSKVEMAKKAKAMGIPQKDISSLTGLSEEEIEAL
jgi:predicted transcriptional regulator